MWSKVIAAALVGACGAVQDDGSPDASANPDGGTDAVPALPFRGMLANLPPVTFGGNPFCTYTIELRQIVIEVTMQAGQVATAQAQNLNVEGVVQPCPHNPAPPSIAMYQFKSAMTTADGGTVQLESAPGTFPRATLALALTRMPAGYEAAFDYHRTDQPVPLDWKVTGSIVLMRQ